MQNDAVSAELQLRPAWRANPSDALFRQRSAYNDIPTKEPGGRLVPADGAGTPTTPLPQPQRQDSHMLTRRVPTALDWPLYQGQDLETNMRAMEQHLYCSYVHRLEAPDAVEYWMPGTFFQDVLVLSFECPSLAYMLISLGATAKLLMYGRDPRLLSTQHAYLGKAIAGQLSAIESGVNRTNFEPLFAAANLIAGQSLLARRFGTHNRASLAGIADWLRSWRSVYTFTAAFSELFSSSRFASYPVGREKMFSTGRELSSDEPVFGFLVQGLARMTTPYKTFSTYRYVAACLSIIYHRPTRELHSRFLVEAPTIFVKAVERCEPTALALMGAHFALSRILDMPLLCDGSAEADLGLLLKYLPRIQQRLLQRAVDVIEARIGDR
ncbi:hypothetical protein GQ53DRAFT_23970 [Thozetella sp. PMI_491]|nr:hypothetical protein GQ53DRAFT_23970 [Thozetella sp. PMI_491]